MIRKAIIQDAKDIVGINIMSWKQTYKGIFPQEFLDNLTVNNENIEKCQNKIKEYAVYIEDNHVVGFIRYGKNKKGYNASYGEIYALYIDSNYQQKGFGKKLVKYSLNELKNNYHSILVSTLINNPANTFYQKIGGKLIGNSKFILENKEYLENLYEFKIEE